MQLGARVRLRFRFACAALALGLALGLWGALPATAWAWANGPQYGEGFGTHDWILYHADQSARRQGYDWVDWPTARSATDDPDMVLRDFYHHVYDRTGEPYGDAPSRVEALYRQAVDQLRGGDRIAASRTLGLLSHYLSDSANPLHTDQTPAEKGMHSRYEDAVDDVTDQPGAGAASLAPHTTAPNTDARGLTEQIAGTAHADYDALVSGFIADRNSPEVQAITERSLNAAVGGVADTIAGISADAGGERGAGSSAVPSLAPGLLSGAMWCVVGMALGAVLVAVLVSVLLLRRRRGASS